MIVVLGLVILVAAVIVGVAGVLANGGHAHAVTHFAVFGYHVTGSATGPARVTHLRQIIRRAPGKARAG
jgi:hypothetical protein